MSLYVFFLILWFFNKFSFFFLDHGVELYSTGCSKKDCNSAIGTIKLDGVQIGGGSSGMNIVILSYPCKYPHGDYN